MIFAFVTFSAVILLAWQEYNNISCGINELVTTKWSMFETCFHFIMQCVVIVARATALLWANEVNGERVSVV